MVDPVTLQMVRDVVAIFGVIAGFSYYVITVRNTTKARKTQLAQHINEEITSIEKSLISLELLEMEWDDYEDYLKKYDSTINHDNYAKRALIWGMYNELGVFLKQNLIDIETVYDLGGTLRPLLHWNKFKPIILEYRKRYDDPHGYEGLEYVATEISNERVRRGLSPNIIDADQYTTR